MTIKQSYILQAIITLGILAWMGMIMYLVIK